MHPIYCISPADAMIANDTVAKDDAISSLTGFGGQEFRLPLMLKQVVSESASCMEGKPDTCTEKSSRSLINLRKKRLPRVAIS